MPPEELDAQQQPPEYDETARDGDVRAIRGLDGRSRGRRATMEEDALIVDLSAVQNDTERANRYEPLFSREPIGPPAAVSSGPRVASPPPYAPGYRIPVVLPEPAVQPVASSTAPKHRSRVRGIRAWWHQESLARAAEKRALANAEAVLRAQAIQNASAPTQRVFSPEERASSMHSLMSLNEERFQALGLRSDRLRDELVGISNSIAGLHDLVTSRASRVDSEAATENLLGELQGRFDSLLPALSEELGRRSEESDRRITLLLSAHAAELAEHLERAVERIGATLEATLPEEMQRMRELIPEEMQRIRTIATEGIERLRPGGEAIERALETLPAEMEKVRSASEAQLVLMEAKATARLERLRAEQNDRFDRIEGSSGDQLARIREEIAGISKSMRSAFAQFVPPSPAGPTTAHDPEMLDRRFAQLLNTMNENTDRLADALYRGLYALELQVTRPLV
jgi:hypothetical protein